MCFYISSHLIFQPPWTVYYYYYNGKLFLPLCYCFSFGNNSGRNLAVGWNWSCSPGASAGWTYDLDNQNYFSSWNHHWFRVGHMIQAWVIVSSWEGAIFVSVAELYKTSHFILKKKKGKKRNKERKERERKRKKTKNKKPEPATFPPCV